MLLLILNYALILTLCIHFVRADWPPYNCKRPINIEDQTVIMTSTSQNKVKTQCEILDTFSGSVYVKFSRIYNQRSSSKSDSVLSLAFSFMDETKFTLEIHNDRLKVVPVEHSDIRLNNDACMAILARHELDWFNWMRVRVNHLSEISRTFISVDLVSYDGNTFTPCVRFETPLMDSDYKITLNGYTDSNMQQEVHQITGSRPDLNTYSKEELAGRISQIEKRVQRIHTTLQRYMGYHDEHAQTIKNAHSQLKDQIIATKNGLKSRTDSHFRSYLFLIVIVIIGICSWISYRFRQANRVHIL